MEIEFQDGVEGRELDGGCVRFKIANYEMTAAEQPQGWRDVP